MQNAKLTLKLTALAGVAATTSTQAAIIVSPTVGSGISPDFNWDVDGDLTVDFRLERSGGSYAYFDDRNGGLLVVPVGEGADGIGKLAGGFSVGATMTGFKFHGFAQEGNAITVSSEIGNDARNSGWVYGETGYFGFKFTSGASTHYGWGELSIGGPSGFTITQAYYENTPGTAITVGSTTAIPEPASAAALLGLGAAGIAAWRRRRAA